MADRGPRPDPYEALGVRRDASGADISRAYRRRARELHPDSRPADSEAADQFRAAAAAYELLSDPARRAAYDHRAQHSMPAPGPGRSVAGPQARPPELSYGRFSPPPGPAVRPGPVRIEPLWEQSQDEHDDDAAVWLAGVLQLIRQQARARGYRPW
jgi:curved DNA-binding protein CbpA